MKNDVFLKFVSELRFSEIGRYCWVTVMADTGQDLAAAWASAIWLSSNTLEDFDSSVCPPITFDCWFLPDL